MNLRSTRALAAAAALPPRTRRAPHRREAGAMPKPSLIPLRSSALRRLAWIFGIDL